MIRESSVSHAGTSLRERAKTNYVTYELFLTYILVKKFAYLTARILFWFHWWTVKGNICELMLEPKPEEM